MASLRRGRRFRPDHPLVHRALVAGLLVALLFAPGVFAQVPTTLNYQGRLLQNTADQDAVAGSVDVVFSIWSGPASDGGAVQLWTETWNGVTLSNGIFSVLLGSNGSPLDPADFQIDSSLFLQLEVDGEVLLPRQQLGSAPFALVDEPANELQDLELAGDTLGLTGSAATVDLGPYLDDTDQQDLSLTGTSLELTNDPTAVSLAAFLDNTDAQTLSLAGNTVTISGSGSSVDLEQATVVQNFLSLRRALDQPRTVFVSSQTYDGGLGGLDGADAECQALADAAALPGTFLAWLSDGTEGPASRFDRFGSFIRVDGAVVANDWDDLTDGSLDNPIARDEQNQVVAASAWTNTTVDGTPVGSDHCAGWTSGGGNGASGDSSATGASWTATGLTLPCSTPSRLYCFQVSSVVNTDDQMLALSGNDLELTSDDGTDVVSLAGFLDNTDSQDLSLSGSNLGITGGSGVSLSGFLDNTDSQDLTLSGSSLGITGGSGVSLAGFLDDTDNQVLSLSGTDLRLTSDDGTDVVSLGSFVNSDNQVLSLSGTTLRLTSDDGTDQVSLAGFLDNTDSQGIASVLANGTDAGDRDLTNLDDVSIDQLTVDADFECDASSADCIRSEHIEQDTILGNDITDRIFILHIDCNGSCADMSMREACDVIENLRGLDFEVELMDVSCVHDVPSTTGNGFVACDDGTEIHGDNECRAFELRTLGDIPCVNGDGTDALVTCYQTDIAK